MLRTHTCGQLDKKYINQTVILCGWVHRRRNHGGLIFIDLRDYYGLTQIKFDPNHSQKTWEVADQLRSEWVVQAEGIVVERPKDMVNKKLNTGEIEVEIHKLKILNKSKTLPFEIDEEKAKSASEHLRLKYRFLDLRRPKLQKMLKTRDAMIRYIRFYFHKNNFLEVQTPILTSSSPEGARDWLVPSRLYQGKFYALPQAPQQFKQLLMIGGIDRYFQIAPCFRDEDPRMDRHYGEFYQLDMEMSFVEQEDIFQIMEPLMVELTEKFSNKKVLWRPFPRISWNDSMTKYGSDKPDLRFNFEIQPITQIVKNCGLKVFTDAIKNNGVVHALKIDCAGDKFTRKDIDELTEIAKEKGAKGLAYLKLKVKNKKLKVNINKNVVDIRTFPDIASSERGKIFSESPITKFLGDDLVHKIVEQLEAKPGDIIFFGADQWRVVCEALGAVRNECGVRLGLKDKNKAAWLWVTDFPMYAYSETEEGKIDFAHNPFSMPQGGLKALNNKDPLKITAFQYDFILNGFELTSGAIRNHDPKIMYKAFEIAGYSKEDVNKKFGAMLRAFEYGAPPHGGNAPGIDRLLMVLNDWDSIRDIYAFPKDGRGRDVMMDAPSEVSDSQLKELGIKLV